MTFKSNHLRVWENYKTFADVRAQLVFEILAQFTEVANSRVLDFGCGEGATARLFQSKGAKVMAYDIRSDTASYFADSGVEFFSGDLSELFAQNKFEVVILQDVLEHVPDPRETMQWIRGSLSTNGLVYISTPNRFSILNFFSDPHWNLPGVALFPRRGVEFLVKKVFRRDRRDRQDWAALLSLKKLIRILSDCGFEITFVNNFVARTLFRTPEKVVCNPWHIRFVNWLRRNGFDKWLIKMVNDEPGFFNNFVNSTWYVIGKER